MIIIRPSDSLLAGTNPNTAGPIGHEVPQKDLGALGLGGAGVEGIPMGQAESTRPDRSSRPRRVTLLDGVLVDEYERPLSASDIAAREAEQSKLRTNLETVGLGSRRPDPKA